MKTISLSRDIFTQADYCIVGREGRKDCPMDSVPIANLIPRDEHLYNLKWKKAILYTYAIYVYTYTAVICM